MSVLPQPGLVLSEMASLVEPNDSLEVDLAEANGQVLAQPVQASWDFPRADNSAMDGFAYYGDIPSEAALKVIGEIAAGAPTSARVQSGEAMAIMTGGWVPQGADRVVPVEQTVAVGDSLIRVQRPASAGAHIRCRGEVHQAGRILIQAGVRMNAVHLAIAASEGLSTVQIFRKPKVAFVVTGNEVVPAAPGRRTSLAPGELFDSHTPLVTGLLAAIGVQAESLGIAGDHVDTVDKMLRDGLDSDVLITTGGVSAGRYDLVPEVVASLGFEIVQHKAAMQPGKPVLIARRNRQWLIGLPGNPAAVLVALHVFVLPLLRALQGDPNAWGLSHPRVSLAEPISPHLNKTRFLPATIDQTGTVYVVPSIGSHHIGPYAEGQLLIELPPGDDGVPVGTELDAIPILSLQASLS